MTKELTIWAIIEIQGLLASIIWLIAKVVEVNAISYDIRIMMGFVY